MGHCESEKGIQFSQTTRQHSVSVYYILALLFAQLLFFFLNKTWFLIIIILTETPEQ